MERIVVNRSATLYKTFYSNGVAADPTGTPTVTITRQSDGTAVTAGAVTDETAAGTWSITIPATSNTLLDTLTVNWTATVNSTPQEHIETVEVAGGTYFTLSELRAVYPGSVTDAEAVDMRTTVEQAIEHACDVAFVPRYTLERLNGTGGATLLLRPHVRAIRSVTVDGAAFTASDLLAMSLGVTGTVYSAARTWAAGSSNILIGYEHGHTEPPAEIKDAALMLAKMRLIGRRSPIDDRAVTFSSNEGGTYSLAVPGRNGSYFGHPDIDAVIARYSMSVGIA